MLLCTKDLHFAGFNSFFAIRPDAQMGSEVWTPRGWYPLGKGWVELSPCGKGQHDTPQGCSR
jgi:hypothetical protein